jgi:hypothetical protein
MLCLTLRFALSSSRCHNDFDSKKEFYDDFNDLGSFIADFNITHSQSVS